MAIEGSQESRREKKARPRLGRVNSDRRHSAVQMTVKKELIRLRINGRLHELAVPPNKLLLDVLREDLGLTGSKRGCDDSSCGACTVLVNGEPQMSCLMLAVSYQVGEPRELSRQHGAAEAISGLELGSSPVPGRQEDGTLARPAEYEITTIEGVADGSRLDPLQRGFCIEGGAQCGYCTPGMILTAKSLLATNPDPSDRQINEALSGNLCRCTGYTQILASVRRAIELMRQGTASAEPPGARPLPEIPPLPAAGPPAAEAGSRSASVVFSARLEPPPDFVEKGGL